MFVKICTLNPSVVFTFKGENYEITHYGYSFGEEAFLSRVDKKRIEHLFLHELHPYIYQKINEKHSESLV